MYWLLLAMCLAQVQADGLFNLDELEKSQYSVTILDTPISLEKAEGDASSDNIMIMMNKFGQKYQCLLPSQSSGDEESGSGSSEPEPEIDVGSLLSSLHSSPCLFRTKDWWTYQVCFGREISQYHVENEKPVGEIMSLGAFNPDRETEDKSMTYYPEWYTNGTKCDLNGRGRETELRFVCNEKAPREFIGDIFEPKSCEYTIVIHTDKICSVPQFKPAPESEPLDISCQPILMKNQMDKYERYAKLKARKIELKRLKVKQEQQKFLKMLSAGSNPLKAIPGFGDQGVTKLIKELGAFMELGSSEPEVKVIDMKGDQEKLLPNRDQDIEKMKKDTEEGWQLIHKPKPKKNVKKELKELQRQLRLKQNYLSRTLNSELLNMYMFIEKAQELGDEEKVESLMKLKSEIQANIKKTQDEIDELYQQIKQLRSSNLNEEGSQEEDNDLHEEDREDDLPKGVLKKEDVGQVKKKVKEEFPSIIKDAMKDLGMKDEDLEAMDETMTAMEDELNVLLKKLQGASDSNSEQDLSSLKRDGKRSVKKELREEEFDQAVDDYGEGEVSDGKAAQTIKETVERLKEMESELDNVEVGLKEKKNKLIKDVEKVKSSAAKSRQGLDELEAESKKLFGDLEAKIEKLGLDKLNLDRPIEVKVIATNVPVGDEDMENMDQNYYDGIMHNIMMGNDKGFKDIQNQYKADKNYKFSMNEAEFTRLEEDVGELESKMEQGGGGFTIDVSDENEDEDLYDVVESDDNVEEKTMETLVDVMDQLLGAPEDSRRRPSSKFGQIEPEDNVDPEENIDPEVDVGDDDAVVETDPHDEL